MKGNCLFRAVAHQLYLDESKHFEIRTLCVNHLIKHKSRFEIFCYTNFNNHIKQLSEQYTWGDYLEIRAMEEIFDRPFYIYSSENYNKDFIPIPINTNYNIDNTLLSEEIIPVKLSYHGKCHYNSVVDRNYHLPLQARNSKVILSERLKIYNKEHSIKS